MFWSVAVTKSANEQRAALNLARQGFVSYLPKYLSRMGKETKVKILFPRYIFIMIESQWHKVNNTFGISRLILTNENTPAIVGDEIIKGLKMREDNKGLISLPVPTKFKSGENIRVANGPFSGYDGLYDGMPARDRARVLIQMLGQQVPIELDESDLVSTMGAVAVAKEVK
jgi:transcription antitermination factor NusG